MSCENEPYRHERQARNCSGRATEGVKGLISSRFRSAVTDIRALRRPDIGSDHNLLKKSFKVKLRIKTENKYNEKRKIVNI
jgi:hypothetical protein